MATGVQEKRKKAYVELDLRITNILNDYDKEKMEDFFNKMSLIINY